MAIKALKKFQWDAIESAVAVFSYARSMLDAAGADAQGRKTAIHENGYLLIEAPTGSGKTLMAGHIVERMSKDDQVVWLWFAPFKGVVDQTAAVLREQFTGLRLRTLSEDRHVEGVQSGDVFVTTWQLVATRMKDRRSVRQTGEQNPSIDDMILSLRQQGFRIGVVVDEAHHGFHADTQAAIFFRGVLEPEYTILVTATPDDDDLKNMQKRMKLGELHRIAVSRADATAQGLIKQGVKCIAWRAEEGNEALVDLEATALREAVALHNVLKSQLQASGVNLTPLILVQVASTDKSIERAKEKLLALGFKESQIAVHTAEEPDAHLMALANDESREVLIFKMAVALGFDAPRAWTLVSMRPTKDESFGVQLVGRILRVHRRLQNRTVPEILRYGYVLLADPDAQGGMDKAGQRINQIRTEIAKVSPTTMILQTNTGAVVQSVGPNGQLTYVPVAPAGAMWAGEAGGATVVRPNIDPHAAADLIDTLFGPTVADEAMKVARSAIVDLLSAPPPVKRNRYELRTDVPRQFKTQERLPDQEIDEEDCAQEFLVSVSELLDVVLKHEKVRVIKRMVEIFTGEYQTQFDFARPSLEQCAVIASRLIRQGGVIDPKILRAALERKLQPLLAEKGVEDANDSAILKEYLDVLLTAYPNLLTDAKKRSLAKLVTMSQAAPLPPHVECDDPLEGSTFNVYGRVPEGLGSWELEFVTLLDNDNTGSVRWWHRNPVGKPWSVRVLLEDGRGFYPDFVVGIANRQTEHGAMLADPKERFEMSAEVPKIIAKHSAYGRAVILAKNPSGQWTVAKFEPPRHASLGTPFRIMDAAQYGLGE